MHKKILEILENVTEFFLSNIGALRVSVKNDRIFLFQLN